MCNHFCLRNPVDYRRSTAFSAALPDTGRYAKYSVQQELGKYPREDSNLQPSAPEADALSN